MTNERTKLTDEEVALRIARGLDKEGAYVWAEGSSVIGRCVDGGRVVVADVSSGEVRALRFHTAIQRIVDGY